MTSTPLPDTEPSPRRQSGWTPERRARQAEAIRSWKPWAKSTGPRTAAGKARAAQNAAKPHLQHAPGHRMERALRAHGRYLSDISRYIRLHKKRGKNELLKRTLRTLRRTLRRDGPKVTAGLYEALLYAKLCKNLDSGPAFPLKVNANEN